MMLRTGAHEAPLTKVRLPSLHARAGCAVCPLTSLPSVVHTNYMRTIKVTFSVIPMWIGLLFWDDDLLTWATSISKALVVASCMRPYSKRAKIMFICWLWLLVKYFIPARFTMQARIPPIEALQNIPIISSTVNVCKRAYYTSDGMVFLSQIHMVQK